ncbi:EamA family transporter RarD [Nocardioides sp.]|uniref:EamA family transporter RarD n=1 Tax=Nocardioides sp. TaxID=35761 RepID=UPI002B27B70A|nr:EamA family transporter RarD [Nocardioides sp.]
MPDHRRGLLLGVGAYALWGAFPLYWPLLEPAGALEILAHRMVWSMLVMGLLVLVLRRVPQVRAIVANRRVRLLLVVAAVTITLNWATFIYGVNSGRVVETSLGYFINPLVTVLLGVFVLGESLRRLQWWALGIGGLAVVVLSIDYGRPPWIALVLAFSFGTYALAKKTASVGPVESLAFETALIAPFALGFLVWLSAAGRSTFTGEGLGHALLLPTTGIVTAIPLILFGAAAVRVPMVSLGLLQYLAPMIQFALGLIVFQESMTPGRWAGFALVWTALAVFTVEALRHRRRQLILTVAASPAA